MSPHHRHPTRSAPWALGLALLSIGCLISEDEARSWADNDCFDGVCRDDTGWPGNGPPSYLAAGSVSVRWAEEGWGECEGVFDLSGRSSAQGCHGCDIALEVTSTQTADSSPGECLWQHLSEFTLDYSHEPDDVTAIAGYSTQLDTSLDTYHNAYWTGAIYGSDPDTTYYESVLEDGTDGATARYDGDSLRWSWSFAGYFIDYVDDAWRYDDCGDTVPDGSGGPPTGGVSLSGDLPCDTTESAWSTHMDVWEFDVGSPEVTIALDTTSDETASDLAFWTMDDFGCVDFWADDQFPCSHQPDAFECPALTANLDEGYNRIVVLHGNRCGGDTVTYRLLIDGDVDNIALLHDDKHQLDNYWTEIEVSGQLALTPAD